MTDTINKMDFEKESVRSLRNNTVLLHESNKISVKFGFIGLGMGGCAIAAKCADMKLYARSDEYGAHYPYTSLLINTNEVDQKKIKPENQTSEKMVIGNGRGAARDRKAGEKIFIDHYSEIQSAARRKFKESEFLWVVAGLGGGTGTGCVIQAIRAAIDAGFQDKETGELKVGLILTLPRLEEGRTILDNALHRLREIQGAMENLGSIILVDNEKLYINFASTHPHATLADYLDFSNLFVAQTLHEINVITSSFEPFSETHFDGSEFEKMIRKPGILHFARFKELAVNIDTRQSQTHAAKLNEKIEVGTLSSGYDLSVSTHAVISILANKNTAKRIFDFPFMGAMSSLVKELAPRAFERPVAPYVYDVNNVTNVYFYAVFAGLEMSSRIRELVDEVKRLNRLEEEAEEARLKKEDLFAGFMDSLQPPKEKRKKDFSEIFSSSSPSASSKAKNDEANALNALLGKH